MNLQLAASARLVVRLLIVRPMTRSLHFVRSHLPTAHQRGLLNRPTSDGPAACPSNGPKIAPTLMWPPPSVDVYKAKNKMFMRLSFSPISWFGRKPVIPPDRNVGQKRRPATSDSPQPKSTHHRSRGLSDANHHQDADSPLTPAPKATTTPTTRRPRHCLASTICNHAAAITSSPTHTTTARQSHSSTTTRRRQLPRSLQARHGQPLAR